MSPPTEPTTPTGRDSHGRFTKGNLGGPGNPHARQVAALRKRLLDKVTADEMDAIIDALLKRAREGDVSAAKLILQYTLGKPLDASNPDRLDADEADAFFSNALNKDTQELAKVHPLDLMLPLFRIAINARGTNVMQQAAQQFFHPDEDEDDEECQPEEVPSTDTDAQPPAEPPPATVSQREEPEPPRGEMFRNMLLTMILTTPGKLTIPAEGKRGLTEIDWHDGFPAVPLPPPLPTVEADRPETASNGVTPHTRRTKKARTANRGSP